jgi:SAM-dependent methyltransferase
MRDASYTAVDHGLRENDAYAKAKYDITMRWLGAAPTPTTRLINIGCGAGLFNRIAREAGYLVEAWEPDPDAYAIAAADARTGVTVHLGGLMDATPSAGADVVVMHDVLEHIHDDAEAARQLASLVAPAGRVVISVPALASLFGLHDDLLGHHRRYNRRTLRQALGSEFEFDQLRYFGMTLIPVTLVLSRLLRRPYPAAAAGKPSLFGRAFAAVCQLEARVPTPIGTSLICRLHPRAQGTSS